jgi:type III secretory pathway component EscV
MISNPVVLVCAPPYAQDHAYTHTVTSPYITDDPTKSILLQRLHWILSLLMTESVAIQTDWLILQGCTSLSTRRKDHATYPTDHVRQGGTRVNLFRQVSIAEHHA